MSNKCWWYLATKKCVWVPPLQRRQEQLVSIPSSPHPPSLFPPLQDLREIYEQERNFIRSTRLKSWSGLIKQQKVDRLTSQIVIFDILEPPPLLKFSIGWGFWASLSLSLSSSRQWVSWATRPWQPIYTLTHSFWSFLCLCPFIWPCAFSGLCGQCVSSYFRKYLVWQWFLWFTRLQKWSGFFARTHGRMGIESIHKCK